MNKSNLPTTKKYFLTVFAIVGILVYLFIVVNIVRTYLAYPEYIYQTDLTAFLTAAETIKGGDADKLYDPETQLVYQNKVVSPVVREKLLPFRNIPLVAVFYIPLTYMTLKTSVFSVFIINLILLFVFQKLLTKHIPGFEKMSSLWLIPLLFWPSIASMVVGQHMGFILITYTLVYISLYKKKDLLAGVFSSFFIIRPHLLLFLPLAFFLTKKRKDYITGLIASSIIIVLINVLSAGLPVLLQNPQFAFFVESEAFGSRSYQLSSIYYMIARLFPNLLQTSLVLINFILYSVFLGIFILKRKYFSLEENFLITLLITTLFSIHVLSHEMLPLLLPICLLLVKEKVEKRSGARWLVPILFFTPVFSLFGASVITASSLLLVLLYYLLLNPKTMFKVNKKSTTTG